MKYGIITIGGATEDIIFYTKEGILINNKKDILRQKLLAFEYGSKIKIDKAYSAFGGGAANAAVCLSRLGFNVSCLIAVGNDGRGELIVRNLEEQGVNTSIVQKVKDIESGFSFSLVGQNNEHIIFSNRAANNYLRLNIADLKSIKNTKWIYMTSLSGKWQDVLNKVFSINKVNIAWNPGHIQLNSGIKVIGKYFKKVKILTVNKDEAIELAASGAQYKNKSFKFLNNIKNLLTIIYGWGPEIVVITNGKYGADAYNGNKHYHQDIIKEKKRVDTTGVGDAFGSTFVAGLELFNGDIQKAMRLAAKNTASVIGQQGAQNGLLAKRDILK
ncbi:MAG: carbohydrate kinase family protein [Patescibacteria group bacterium]|nr:carbohydrate kinase family protein [Patescibacteria group bacterium]